MTVLQLIQYDRHTDLGATVTILYDRCDVEGARSLQHNPLILQHVFLGLQHSASDFRSELKPMIKSVLDITHLIDQRARKELYGMDQAS